jgi:hypothetical protein
VQGDSLRTPSLRGVRAHTFIRVAAPERVAVKRYLRSSTYFCLQFDDKWNETGQLVNPFKRTYTYAGEP